MNEPTQREIQSAVRRTKKEAHNNLLALITIITLVVILPLLTLVYVFNQQKNERISCGELSPSSVKYLESVGENLPLSCTQ